MEPLPERGDIVVDLEEQVVLDPLREAGTEYLNELTVRMGI